MCCEHGTLRDLTQITIEGNLHPSIRKLASRDQISLELQNIPDVLQFQHRAIREVDCHIALPDYIAWFIISQSHPSKITFHIVLKDFVMGNSMKESTRINDP